MRSAEQTIAKLTELGAAKFDDIVASLGCFGDRVSDRGMRTYKELFGLD